MQTSYSDLVSYPIGDSFLLMHDLYRLHTARNLQNIFEMKKKKNTAYGVAYLLSWLKCDRVCLVHTRTMHYRKTNASVDCPGLEDCTSWRVGPNFPNILFDNLIASIETRCATVVSIWEDHAPYKISLHPLQTPLFFCHLHVSKLVPWSISSCSWHQRNEIPMRDVLM